MEQVTGQIVVKFYIKYFSKIYQEKFKFD